MKPIERQIVREQTTRDVRYCLQVPTTESVPLHPFTGHPTGKMPKCGCGISDGNRGSGAAELQSNAGEEGQNHDDGAAEAQNNGEARAAEVHNYVT